MESLNGGCGEIPPTLTKVGQIISVWWRGEKKHIEYEIMVLPAETKHVS